MGKNQITINDSTIQSQGICEKNFKIMNINPAFRSFRRSFPDESPKFATNSAKASVLKPVSLELNRQQIPSQGKYQNLSSDSNMVLVEYNHIGGDMNSATTHKYKTEPMKAMNKSSIENNMISIVHHHQINELDDNERFSNYIDHVKNKMRNMSNFDDDHKVTHHNYIIDRSKININ
ncbi:hypothetical protein R3W88_025151 [Solanum pinnatisectum]|uniref:Uncharacterized protein n=1 Tax=Solanum pinnatisectum TaxID=50273 RepID=A0AAV9M310_9SOLN|nr:hypothetical protein R3W88_025151 [Solanum pinnatisectum]